MKFRIHCVDGKTEIIEGKTYFDAVGRTGYTIDKIENISWWEEVKDEDEDSDFECCGIEMDTVGLSLGNGWQCSKCGRIKYDVASVKMSGNYEEYLNN